MNRQKKQQKQIQEIKPVKLANDDHEMSENALLRQLKEEERREKIQIFLIKYQKQLIYFVVLALVIACAFGSYSIYRQNQNVAYSKLIHQSLVFENLGKKKEYLQILEEIRSKSTVPDNIRAIALLKYGSELVEQNKIQEAVDVYLQANDLNSDPYFRELAGLLAVKSMIDSGDKKFNDRITQTLVKLEKTSEILKPFILEQKGIFNWMQSDYKGAAAIFEKISKNDKNPEFLKLRATEFHNILKSY